MKKIGFVTTNKVLAQSLAITSRSRRDWAFEPYLLLDPGQAVLDAQVLKLDAAVVDVADAALEAIPETMRRAAPGCRLLLLVPQGNQTGRKEAIRAVQSGFADDFVFCDTSLEYLFAKLAAI
jgi:hypothetical protein